MLSWHVLRLGAARVRSPILLPGSRQVIWLQDEPRVAVAAVVEGPPASMTVASTHLSFVPGWNAVQLRRLTRWLRALPGPHVLLGDLNMPPLGVRGLLALAGARAARRRTPRRSRGCSWTTCWRTAGCRRWWPSTRR